MGKGGTRQGVNSDLWPQLLRLVGEWPTEHREAGEKRRALRQTHTKCKPHAMPCASHKTTHNGVLRRQTVNPLYLPPSLPLELRPNLQGRIIVLNLQGRIIVLNLQGRIIVLNLQGRIIVSNLQERIIVLCGLANKCWFK